MDEEFVFVVIKDKVKVDKFIEVQILLSCALSDVKFGHGIGSFEASIVCVNLGVYDINLVLLD